MDFNLLQPGLQLASGRFLLMKPLGCGGMSQVWLAQDERLHEQAARATLTSPALGKDSQGCRLCTSTELDIS
jgi:hypothetical protein